jgi:hypothetical protein
VNAIPDKFAQWDAAYVLRRSVSCRAPRVRGASGQLSPLPFGRLVTYCPPRVCWLRSRQQMRRCSQLGRASITLVSGRDPHVRCCWPSEVQIAEGPPFFQGFTCGRCGELCGEQRWRIDAAGAPAGFFVSKQAPPARTRRT